MEKRMIVAIVLSMVIFFGFQKMFPKKAPTGNVPVQQSESSVLPSGKTEQTPQIPVKEELETIETDKFILVFSNIGGTLKQVILKRENGSGDEVINTEDPSLRPFAMRSAEIPGLEKKTFSVKRTPSFLEYSYNEPGAMSVKKTFTFDNSSNHILLTVENKNLSGNRILFSYSMNGPGDIIQSDQVTGRSFLQAVTLLDGKLWKANKAKGIQERSGNVTWTAMKTRYFALALKPFTSPRSVGLRSLPGKNMLTVINTANYPLQQGQSKEDEYLFYAGPLEEKDLAATGYNLQQLVDFGFFGGVSKVLLSVLGFFHGWTGNWGISIILLTVMINLLLFPLTAKSFKSMQQMKKIQPHMQKLREIHKDDPQKLNKEMMELYKKYNVNPLGGCLPLLLQMPIFIALYQGLIRFGGLKGSNFLWISDLSRPDAVSLPFSLPLLGASINILPLLMVGMMFLQQKITQGASAPATGTEQEGQQKMMMFVMPLFFGFLFYKMPSGLVLYWLTNTILMTTEQGIIGRNLHGE